MTIPAEHRAAPSWTRWAPWIILVAGLVAYANSLTGAFVFDDIKAVVDNRHIRSWWPMWEAVVAAKDSSLAGRPVASFSFALNFALGGLDVRGYHVVNLAIHLTCALLLYGLMRRSLGQPALQGRCQQSAPRLALAVALLWVVHPMTTEAVTYIIQRTESLMACWLLLTLYAAMRAADAPRPGRWQITALVACGLGMATKEVMVVAPLLTLGYDRVFRTGTLCRALHRRP